MDKLTADQKKRLWLRLMTPNHTWQTHAKWIKKQFGLEVTDEEVSAFYMARLLDPA